MIAVGVASPSAHGQAMIRTATKFSMANRNAGCGPTAHQTANVSTAIPITVGTKMPATRSASRWMGALEPCASSTSRMIWARTVSFPTLVASNRNMPVLFSVAPITGSPGRFSTGMLSPVSMDSSTAEAPSRTTPSTGIFSPGRTTTRSPIRTSSTGMSASAPSRTTRAVFAWRPISRFIASDVRPLATDSRSRPSRISVMITAAVS